MLFFCEPVYCIYWKKQANFLPSSDLLHYDILYFFDAVNNAFSRCGFWPQLTDSNIFPPKSLQNCHISASSDKKGFVEISKLAPKKALVLSQRHSCAGTISKSMPEQWSYVVTRPVLGGLSCDTYVFSSLSRNDCWLLSNGYKKRQRVRAILGRRTMSLCLHLAGEDRCLHLPSNLTYLHARSFHLNKDKDS